jgi:hypothetical protein
MAAWPPKGVCSMRNLLLAITMLIAFLIPAPAAIAATAEDWLNLDHADKGTIGVRYDARDDVKTKVMVTKGPDKYTYLLTPGKWEETFPLQMGNGDYTVTLLEQVSGSKYKVVREAAVTLNMDNDANVYLNPVQNVNWSETSRAAVIAKELTKTAATDMEKVRAIYEYVTGTIRYDETLAANVPADYIPDIDRTVALEKDICYGYAALFAAMLRSVDIPAKLVMGTTEYVDVYHAWNEVYYDGAWTTIDTTVDAGWKENGKTFEMTKDATRYAAAKYY